MSPTKATNQDHNVEREDTYEEAEFFQYLEGQKSPLSWHHMVVEEPQQIRSHGCRLVTVDELWEWL